MKTKFQLPGMEGDYELRHNLFTNKLAIYENGDKLVQDKREKGKPFFLENGARKLVVKPSILGVTGVMDGQKIQLQPRLTILELIFVFLPMLNLLLWMGAIPGIISALGVGVNLMIMRSSFSLYLRILFSILTSILVTFLLVIIVSFFLSIALNNVLGNT